MAWRDKKDPHEIFSEWYEATKQELEGAYKNSFILCTTGLDGEPNGRTVLLRDHTQKDESGNFVLVWLAPDVGIKAAEIEKTHKATAVFLWSSKNWTRQGTVTKESKEVSEKYFKDLPRQFQIGTWVSKQDLPIPDLSKLEADYQQAQTQFPDDKPVPISPTYHAFFLHPLSYEFYEGGDIMIHNLRAKYTKESKNNNNDVWVKTLLAP